MFWIRLTRSFVLLGILSAHWAIAQTATEIELTSRYDRFSLLRSGGQYKLAGKSVKLGTLEEILPLFSAAIEGDCPKGGKSDLTVKAKISGQWIERKFYVAERMVRGDNQCTTINGDGLYFAPLHHSWFDPDETLTISLKGPFKVVKNDEVFATFDYVKGDWRNGRPGEYPNWDFFNSFRDALTDFPVQHRIHPSAAKDKMSFTLEVGKKKYTFYKISGSIWAVKHPKYAWLVSSARWGNWLDMDKEIWLDRSAPQLSFIADKGKQTEERRGTMASLEGQWTPSIREVLTQVLLDKDEPVTLKVEAVRLMRNKPTIENVEAWIKALMDNDDVDLQYALSQALRVRNPKGPSLTPDLTEAKRSEAISEWRTWWKSVEGSKDKF